MSGIDWSALGDETLDLLRRYLMIDTTNPPGNEADGVRFLAEVLDTHGVRSETAESAPGRANPHPGLSRRMRFDVDGPMS